jgi:hypothetical protein
MQAPLSTTSRHDGLEPAGYTKLESTLDVEADDELEIDGQKDT